MKLLHRCRNTLLVDTLENVCTAILKKRFWGEGEGRWERVSLTLPCSVSSRVNINQRTDNAKELIGTEQRELISTEQRELISSEQRELFSSEQRELISSEQSELISTEQKELMSPEQRELISTEQRELMSPEQRELISTEQRELIGSEQREFDKLAKDVTLLIIDNYKRSRRPSLLD